MAPLNFHFDGTRQRDEPDDFQWNTRPYGNSTVGHKFFVTGGVKREMDTADINGAYAILSKCIFALPTEQAFTHDLSVTINEIEQTEHFYSFK